MSKIKAEDFVRELKKRNMDFFAGVPDSLLKQFCSYIKDTETDDKNIITANEGNAIGLGAGYHLATNKIPVIYMQNSGLGNTVNPLTSMTDKEVYSIPMLLIVGWRGEPGKKDEPQHVKKGRITTDLLSTLEIPYAILNDSIEDTKVILDEAIKYMKECNAPFAIVVKKDLFEKYDAKNKDDPSKKYELTREEAIKTIIERTNDKDILVSTTGKASREVFEHRANKKEGHHRDFLTVGSMGHSSQIAAGIALSKKDRNVTCIDGDGAMLMHLGGLAIIGQMNLDNFNHILINNGCHESVGGQPTVGFQTDFTKIAKACNYTYTDIATTKDELKEKLKQMNQITGTKLLEVRVRKGARENLGRPTTTPVENKKAFMKFLE